MISKTELKCDEYIVSLKNLIKLLNESKADFENPESEFDNDDYVAYGTMYAMYSLIELGIFSHYELLKIDDTMYRMGRNSNNICLEFQEYFLIKNTDQNNDIEFLENELMVLCNKKNL